MRRMFSQPAKRFFSVLSRKTGRITNHRYAGLPFWKRLFDLLLILVLLPGALLLALAVAVTIRLGSKGPILFRQQRVGFKGRLFTCYKFRTMHVQAECSSHRAYTRQLMKSEIPMTKLDCQNDPRLIPLGAVIRATGLDELPQLMNVLLGDMSIVGPRPCIPYEYEAYEVWQRKRFNAFPGLTGLWQVNGKNRTTFNQMIQMDIEYSERLSPWLDLKIVILTIPTILKQCLEVHSGKRRSVVHSSDFAKPIQTHRI